MLSRKKKKFLTKYKPSLQEIAVPSPSCDGSIIIVWLYSFCNLKLFKYLTFFIFLMLFIFFWKNT